MKILQINIFGNLSTGKIAVDLYRTLKQAGHEGVVAFARNTIAADVPNIKIGSKRSVYMDGILSRLTDRAGFYSKRATRRLIEQIKEYDPDIIHLHNLHGYYINIELLFAYLRESGKPVVWTLHDCWAFTGHCCYYSMAGCDKWKNGCSQCPQRNAYPKSLLFDNSKNNYLRKRRLFTSIPNLQLVCVSNWLAEEVKQSFLREIPCCVIHNGIDTKVFQYSESSFREKYKLEDKKIVLSVSSSWSDERKGLKDVLHLAKIAEEAYKVIVVGLTEEEKRQMPEDIIAITRTNSMQELAELYSTADYFFNASVEETFGLPTVEAMACGTPAIVYDATALPEVVNKNCGYVVPQHDIYAVRDIVTREDQSKFKDISKYAEPYSKEVMMKKYLALYSNLIKEKALL